MALQVWLPLIGDIHNQGLSPVTTSVVGAAVSSTEGKLGVGAYNFTAWSNKIQIDGLDFSKLKSCSISFWCKASGYGTSGFLPVLGQDTSHYILASAAGTGDFYHNLVGSNQKKIYVDGKEQTVPGSKNVWHHYTITGLDLSSWTTVNIGSYSSAWWINGQYQDFRIYDHNLSAREVQEIAKGLVVHYPLNDPQFTNSKVYDCSGYGNHGTPTGNLSVSEDSARHKRSTAFTSTSYIRCNTRPANLPKDAITVNLWMNFSTFGNPISCTESGGWNFENDSNLRFPVFISGVGYILANSGVSVSTLANSWHMLTGIFDGTNVKIYIDGELKGSTPTNSTNGIGYANNWLFLAAEAQDNTETPASQTFVGKISDVRIYATALSDDQVRELYNNPISVCKNGNLMCMEVVEP